ncbi:MAG TPA: transglycosylase domain-containing protein [Saprospiraceae bacterium]|nr:transglycosylase domain-containing protein [Saprospiraceae bacterium]
MTIHPTGKINSEAIRQYFKNLWPRFKAGIQDPKKRRKWFFRGLYIFGGFILLFVSLFLLTWAGLFGSIPNKKTLLAIRQPEASKIYSADGKLMGKYYTKNRNTLQFDQIPPEFMNSLIAVEDERFWTHHGIDFRSWMRVLVKRMILGQESAGGGSTLSQQLAKNLFPRKDFWAGSMLINKFREFIIASRLENAYSKEQLLTFYVNTVPFGENIYGLDAAADRYFSKTADTLAIEESALLVGLLKATSYFNPRNFPERAVQRRNVVMYQMVVNGMIDSLMYDSLSKIPLKLSYQRNTDSEGIALYFRNQLRPVLLEWCKTHTKPDGEPYNLFVDGLKVYTTIDFGMQQYAEEAVKAHVSKLQSQFDKQFKDYKEYEDPLEDLMQRSSRYGALVKSGYSDKDIRDSFDVKQRIKWWTWDGVIDTIASPLDSLKHDLRMLQGALVAINPKTGGVLAWVGGNDASQFNIDYLITPRQPGSAFKPMVYATAIDQGISPCSFYPNELHTYVVKNENWTPRNSDYTYGGYYSFNGALAHSVNTIAVQLIYDTGIDAVIQKARRMGIRGELPKVPSLALGTAEVTLLDLTSAYSTFITRGNHRPYILITRIEDADGTVLEEYKSQPTTNVFTEETVLMMDQLLASVVDGGMAGTLRYIYGLKGALAGKTGTTQFQSDGLFVGFSPKFIAGTWVGCFDRRVSFNSLRDGQGSKTALPIWGEFVKRLQDDPEYKSYFTGYWPEEYQWVRDCPFTSDGSDLVEVNPAMAGDSTAWPRRYVRRSDQNRGIGQLIEDIFGKKDKKEGDQSEENKEDKNDEKKKKND